MLIGLAIFVLLAPPASAATLEFIENLRVETAGTEAEFGRIRDIAIAPDDRIYVADGGFGLIHVFDDRGRFIRSFGRVGEGPGDLPRYLIHLAFDPDGNLLVAGRRSNLGVLSPEGEFLDSIPLDVPASPTALFCLPDGSVGYTSTCEAAVSASGTPAWTGYLIDRKGTRVASFGNAHWWKQEWPRYWMGGMLDARAAADPETGQVVFAHGRPFELHRYDPDGTLVDSTTEGLDGFVQMPALPVETGTMVSFDSTAGRVTRVIVLPDRRILVRAARVHPDDVDREDELDRPVRVEHAIALYDSDLALIAEVRSGDLPGVQAVDSTGGLWASGFDEDEIPCVIRYGMRLVD